jgi:ATP-dependent RNA helicase RhlE
LNFSSFNLHPDIMEAIEAIGFEKPTPVQEQAIPIVIEGHDLIACAQTGTGKTAAYVLPLLHSIVSDNNPDTIRALVIAPTRELAMQIDQQLEGFSYFAGVSSIAVYGGGSGTDFEMERKAIKTGTGVIVATPGRLISHLNAGYVNLKNLKHLILDEADRMLDMGFLPDIQKIVSFLPEKRQTLMFSATMPKEIRGLARNIMQNPKELTLELAKPPENVLQAAYFVADEQKTALLKKLITGKDLPSVLIFSSTKSSVKDLERDMLRLKLNVRAIHSDLDQTERKEVLRLFKNREVQILVATDIVSRGIDIENISLVINYNVPQDAEDYVHRVGRTARAEKTGVALTFVNNREKGSFKRIEQLIASEIKKLPLPAELGQQEADEHYDRRSSKKKPFRKKKGGQSGRKEGHPKKSGDSGSSTKT